MNSDFENFDDMLGGTSPWDASSPLPLPLAGIAAYYNTRKDPMSQPRSVSDLVSNGVNACLLALDTIGMLEHDKHPSAQAMVAASRNVLRGWNLEIKPCPSEPTAPAEVKLMWPPAPGEVPPLDAAYGEVYYAVIVAMTAVSPNAMLTLEAGTQLILKSSYWNRDTVAWNMEFLEFGKADGPGNRFWLSSTQVQPAAAVPTDDPVAVAQGGGAP